MEKHCNNSQCFKEKNYKAKFLISSILKKIDRDNLRKKNNKTNTKKRKKKSC
jgi:gluconate kinase